MADSASASGGSLLDAVRREIEQRLSLNKEVQWSVLEPAAIRQSTSRKAIAGWKMELGTDYLGKARALLLYLPESFPHDPPRAHVWPTAYQEWPHGEPSGRLCLWREDEPPDCSDPATLVEDYFNRIGQLLKLVRPGTDPELRRLEFQDEWLSYWIPANKKRFPSATIWSVRLRRRSRRSTTKL